MQPIHRINARLKPALWSLAAGYLCFAGAAGAAEFTPAPQEFRQEVALNYGPTNGLPEGRIQLLQLTPGGAKRVFAAGKWFEFQNGGWQADPAIGPQADASFVFNGPAPKPVTVPVPWREVRQVLHAGTGTVVATAGRCWVVEAGGSVKLIGGPAGGKIAQVAAAPDGLLYAAAAGGLFARAQDRSWQRLEVQDGQGRIWAAQDVLGVAFDGKGQLWFAVKAGVGCRTAVGWRFYEGKDGLPWNDFTGIAAGPEGEIWFGTHLGVIRFDGKDWHYRQGRRWLPDDDVGQLAVDGTGAAWFATGKGVGVIERKKMTLAQKAEYYEQEIEKYVKRTPYGFVSQAQLRRAGDRSSADPQDDDNDGLWTCMYGAGESFAYAATQDPKAKERARKAFEALRFLQQVTQGGEHSPDKGFVARSIRPLDWPDPNIGRLAADREAHEKDSLWKIYEPRWPKSADGKWYWKSDTSSDELDGHYFFYPLYYDFCADTDAERERVREVIRAETDHLVAHGFRLVDHDGKPTRWGIYSPEDLNHNPLWWQERGLKSLSMLSYLAGAAHVTGDPKYDALAKELIEQHAYAHNAMHTKEQQGPGSGNQSDDEMAVMCYYNVLRFSKDENLKLLMRYSFFHYWMIEAPEMNPFFNFAYAGQNLKATVTSPYETVSVAPWAGWHEDAMTTLYGFPLDRLSWGQRNSHRLDLHYLPAVASEDVDGPDEPRTRGYRVNGKVIPVENRYFGHWNTDPWRLDYKGHGEELGAGTVFLLPYYLGLYHGFIQKP